MSSEIKNNLKFLLRKIESRASYLHKHFYEKHFHTRYNDLIVENLMCNGRCHLVAVFKNYLIEDDTSEYLRRFYKYRESPARLKKLFLYHEETSVIFPNYTPLEESKYLYNNVIKKQRVIDEQQDLENIRNNLKLKKKDKEFILKKEEKVFNSTVFGEILTSSESVLRIIFGINKNDIIKQNEKTNLNEEKNKINEYDDIKNLIKELENAEENLKNSNNSSLVGYKLSSNNVLKYKLKLLNNSNNIQIKNKNYELLNNITNNSTNNTNSSNNINNNNKNINKIKNNQNLSFKENVFFNNNINRNLIIANPNSKKLIKNKYNNNLTKYNHKKSNSTIPNRTLYGLNFYPNNYNNNNLINQEKKNNYKNNSNSQSNNTSKLNNNTINSNYIYNNNFPHNIKKIEKNINNINNINNNKYNLSNKSNKALNKIPKIDLHKLDIINNNNTKILTLTNRSINRNYNHILNNPNLFFAETEALKSERLIMRKRSQNKNMNKNKMNTIGAFSPSNYKSNAIFGRNSNTKLVIINEQNLKSLNQPKKNNHYFSNKNINKSSKKLIINEYNYKTNANTNKRNYNNLFFSNFTGNV